MPTVPSLDAGGFAVAAGLAATGFDETGLAVAGFLAGALVVVGFAAAGFAAAGLAAHDLDTAGFARDFGRRFGVGGGGMRDDDGVGVPGLDMPDPEASCRREGEAATSFASPRIGDAGRDDPTSSSRCTDNVLPTLSPLTAPLPLLRLRVA